MPKPRVVHVFSAGGVVYRQVADAPASAPSATSTLSAFAVVLVGHPAESLWVLPKGTPRAGETPEETAVREVREETGVEPRIVGDLGSIAYWFTRKGVRHKKEVQHYLMEAVGGDVARHDHEYDEARWFPLDEAIERLAHENEAEVVRRAAEALNARFGGAGSDRGTDAAER